ncbi:MAG: response regulator [Acidobacteriota bacterium]
MCVGSGAESRTVLIIEDEAALRRLMRKMLEREGFEVLEAGGPSEALEVCRQSAAELDVLITDLMMPEMTGGELATQLSGSYPHLKVLFMSGYGRADIEAQGLLSPGEAFLSKPFNVARLCGAIEALFVDQVQEANS